MELYELKDNFKNLDTNALINNLVDEYQDLKITRQPASMIQNKFMYIVGVLDTLFRCKEISQKEYTLWCKHFGL